MVGEKEVRDGGAVDFIHHLANKVITRTQFYFERYYANDRTPVISPLFANPASFEISIFYFTTLFSFYPPFSQINYGISRIFNAQFPLDRDLCLRTRSANRAIIFVSCLSSSGSISRSITAHATNVLNAVKKARHAYQLVRGHLFTTVLDNC